MYDENFVMKDDIAQIPLCINDGFSCLSNVVHKGQVQVAYYGAIKIEQWRMCSARVSWEGETPLLHHDGGPLKPLTLPRFRSSVRGGEDMAIHKGERCLLGGRHL
eukprot:Gb_18846 [translate_table: standard]